MRLIAMSAHTKLKASSEQLSLYQRSVNQLFHRLYALAPNWKTSCISPASKTQLIILIGSQKGLCGSFNAHLFTFFEQYHKKHPMALNRYLVVGRKAVDYMLAAHPDHIINTYQTLTIKTVFDITDQIIQHILLAPTPFSSVVIISNVLKRFFLQKPVASTLLPLVIHPDHNKNEQPADTIWQQSPTELLDIFLHQYLQTHIYNALFQSLLAEQAARFISMDSSTQSADSMLQETKLWYNKVRQANITKELTERAEL